MSLEFVRKQGFRLKKIKKLIYIRNMNGTFNKKELIENTVKVNIFYKEHEIDVISSQKQNVILEMQWLACHNHEIDQKTSKVKITKCLEECGKIEVKQVAEEWKIWDKEKKIAKLDKEAKKLVPPRFHKQIYFFGKKVSKRILMRKIQNHAIELKERFVLQKEKIYTLSRNEREGV